MRTQSGEGDNLMKRQPHRFMRRLEDIDPVNGLRIHQAETNGERLSADAYFRTFPLPLRQLFRVADAVQTKPIGKNNAGGHDRPGQRAASDLINPRHTNEPRRPCGLFMLPEACFGSNQ